MFDLLPCGVVSPGLGEGGQDEVTGDVEAYMEEQVGRPQELAVSRQKGGSEDRTSYFCSLN